MRQPLAPAFNPAAEPYAKGIYAEGIVESYQNNGENINIYPKVPGTIVEIPVHEGQVVRKERYCCGWTTRSRARPPSSRNLRRKPLMPCSRNSGRNPRGDFEVSKAQLTYAGHN